MSIDFLCFKFRPYNTLIYHNLASKDREETQNGKKAEEGRMGKKGGNKKQWGKGKDSVASCEIAFKPFYTHIPFLIGNKQTVFASSALSLLSLKLKSKWSIQSQNASFKTETKNSSRQKFNKFYNTLFYHRNKKNLKKKTWENLKLILDLTFCPLFQFWRKVDGLTSPSGLSNTWWAASPIPCNTCKTQ